ncbi:hypothetical protein GCM10009823_22660 [Brevibacterium salitolerans]|uniref:DUF559 domain-containing protein n=1 Tax=Brevibacterium salitolerans TaxID=1403566 RepID=A0ABN2WWY8_9MICO
MDPHPGIHSRHLGPSRVSTTSTATGGFARDGEVLVREKRRQHALEKAGFTVIRLLWRDVVDAQCLRLALAAQGLLI